MMNGSFIVRKVFSGSSQIIKKSMSRPIYGSRLTRTVYHSQMVRQSHCPSTLVIFESINRFCWSGASLFHSSAIGIIRLCYRSIEVAQIKKVCLVLVPQCIYFGFNLQMQPQILLATVGHDCPQRQ